MAQGRCAGCGDTGPARDILRHQVSCGKFAELYRKSPQLCLPPEQEYQRWRAQDKGSETEQRIAGKVAATQAQRSAMADRFRTPNILED